MYWHSRAATIGMSHDVMTSRDAGKLEAGSL
jgi:hypothetical protein